MIQMCCIFSPDIQSIKANEQIGEVLWKGEWKDRSKKNVDSTEEKV